MVVTSETKEDVGFITLLGRLMFDESLLSLREQVLQLRDAGINRFVFDISGVPHCDSSGCGEIISAYSSIKKAGGVAAFVNPTDRVRLIWTRIKLTDVFPIFDNLKDAEAFVRTAAL